MYLDHFGLSAPPFSDSPITDGDCFYEGGGRGATLDSLIYVLTHGEGREGIIAVTGESGSGKTVICRLLMKRLPVSMQIVYLGKKDLPKGELLNSIVDELKFQSEKAGIAHIPAPVEKDELQRVLAGLRAAGRQVVLLIDEAHTLSAETLEALRLLYEHESSHHKLLQIVLVGQAGLESTVASPPLRKVKETIRHHWVLQPLHLKAASEYLIYRLRAAGYRGAVIFSPAALRLIDRACNGLMRQLDILADKSLMAAFLAQVPGVEVAHVQTAIKDIGVEPRFDWRGKRNRSELLSHCIAGIGAVSSAAVVMVLGVVGWQALRPQSASMGSDAAPLPLEVSVPSTLPTPATATIYPTAITTAAPSVPPSGSAAAPVPSAKSNIGRGGEVSAPTAATDKTATGKASAENVAAGTAQNELPAEGRQAGSTKINVAGVKLAGHELLEQRIEATLKAFSSADKNFYTIQLYATDNIQPDRMERFLIRARDLVDLSNLYVHPVSNGDQAKFIVTYGIYTGQDEASMAVDGLPEKYRTAFNPELRVLNEIR